MASRVGASCTGRWNPSTAGRARSLLREILSPTRAKLPELMCAIEKMEDLVRRHSCRRDAQGNAHDLAEDIRMSSLEALLPETRTVEPCEIDFVWCPERRNQNML